MSRQPTFYLPHGGGPCFFMPDPNGTWTGMERFLRDLPSRLPARPDAILIVSGHWEEDGFAILSGERPPMLYDYYGFPAHTYALDYPAPGAPALAARLRDRIAAAGFPSTLDGDRGFDHGVFVPLMVAFPEADIPVIEMSLDKRLDPAMHLAAGRALAPLRDENILILGTGMSFHNMRAYGRADATAPSEAFDAWLVRAVTSPAAEREAALLRWQEAPCARYSHPREEHLLPLMVAAGAATTGKGEHIYAECVLSTAISAFRFD